MTEKIKNLENKILKHKALYYQGRSEISDYDYDKLEEDLREIDPNNPVLNIVGTKVKETDKVGHVQKMLSLNKTYKWEELEKWRGEEQIVSLHKIDGISCSLIYEKGALVMAKTRGDGQFGEDITQKALWIGNIPKTIEMKNCEVRGELYCSNENFLKLSQEMEELKLNRPQGQRNIVAGLVGRKVNIELCRHLLFYAFEIISEEANFTQEWEKIELLKKMNFDLPEARLHHKSSTIKKAIEQAGTFMAEGSYLIDGIVFSYNQTKLQEELGNTAHHPRFRLAFKFQGSGKRARIEHITWHVSRNGNIIPVGNIVPVEFSGAKVSRVTLHNYGMVKQYKLKANDEIEIIRSGEVIPKFLSVISSSKNQFVVPNKCPSCQTPTEKKKVHLSCPNAECIGKIKEEVLHFVQTIGIEDLSKKRLDAMFEKGLIKDVVGLYQLDEEKLLSLEKTKEKLASKILKQIERSKDVDLITFLSALGIAGGAYNKCERIVNAGLDTIEKLEQMSLEDLCKVELFAEKSASEFITSLESKWPLVHKLLEQNLKLRPVAAKKGKLAYKNFVITGTLSKKRSKVEADIKSKGGAVLKQVAKTTHYLVTNDKDGTSTKAKRAKSLKIPILCEEKLYELMDES